MKTYLKIRHFNCKDCGHPIEAVVKGQLIRKKENPETEEAIGWKCSRCGRIQKIL